MSDTTQDDGEIDYDVQTEYGFCNNESVDIYELENGDIGAIERAGCDEVLELQPRLPTLK